MRLMPKTYRRLEHSFPSVASKQGAESISLSYIFFIKSIDEKGIFTLKFRKPDWTEQNKVAPDCIIWKENYRVTVLLGLTLGTSSWALAWRLLAITLYNRNGLWDNIKVDMQQQYGSDFSVRLQGRIQQIDWEGVHRVKGAYPMSEWRAPTRC